MGSGQINSLRREYPAWLNGQPCDATDSSLCQWERSDPDPRLFEDYDSALRERVLDDAEVPKERRDLPFGMPLRATTKQDERRLGFFAAAEQRAEVGVGGNKHPVFGGGQIEETGILCSMQ